MIVLLVSAIVAAASAREIEVEGDSWLGMMRRVLSLRVFQTFDERTTRHTALEKTADDASLSTEKRDAARTALLGSLFADAADRANHQMLLDAQHSDCKLRNGVYDAKRDLCVVTVADK